MNCKLIIYSWITLQMLGKKLHSSLYWNVILFRVIQFLWEGRGDKVTSTYATTWEYSKFYCGNYDNNDDSLVLLNGLFSFYTSPFMNLKYLGQNGRPNWNHFLLCPFKISTPDSSNE